MKCASGYLYKIVWICRESSRLTWKMRRLDSATYHHHIYLPVPKKPFFPFPFSGLAGGSLSLLSLTGWLAFETVFIGFSVILEGAGGAGRFGVVFAIDGL